MAGLGMIYVSLPDGVVFQAAKEREDGIDSLIVGADEKVFSLQAIVKEFSLNRARRSIALEGLTLELYELRPPKDARRYLEYLARSQGKAPTTWAEVIIGLDKHKPIGHLTTTADDLALIGESAEAFRRWKRERRENLRKSGDSPAAN